MPLPAPSLDDRHFQDIVDQAKRLIPRYCREWTDHNVSDPGVTLIELFAWMTDMLLYRVNQVPDKNYIKFLDLIGVQLEGPRAAEAPITFYLSAAQPKDVVIPKETEVATVRTEQDEAIIFTTVTDLAIRAPKVLEAFTRNMSRDKDGWTRHHLRQAEQLKRTISIFPTTPAAGDAFILALKQDLSHHVVALVVECENAGGAGVNPNKPPIQWQVWQGEGMRWVNCELEHDGTGGFNKNGEVVLYLPAMAEREFEGVKGFWLRCSVTDAQKGEGAYKRSPLLKQIVVESRGGTVAARHATTVRDEVLGSSDGTPGQIFQLLHHPILTLEPATDYLLVQPPAEKPQRWKEVTDFAASGSQDRHFTLDKLDGTITLGPSLLQPDGSVWNFGIVPEKGSVLRFSRYQYGGGVAGNVVEQTLTVLKSSIPYVARVTNRQGAEGGRDAQSLEDAKLRAPQMLRTRTRAVTADDYEYLASEVAGVARAYCIAPGAQPASPDDPKPGQVVVVVLPQVDVTQGRIAVERLRLSAELRATVQSTLNACRLLGTTLDVRSPQYTEITILAELRVPERSDPTLIAEVQQQAEDALYRYLNPYTGGPRGDGWPFGRALNRSEMYGLLQGIEQVEYVEALQIRVSEANAIGQQPAVASSKSIPIPRAGLIYSGRHQVKVS